MITAEVKAIRRATRLAERQRILKALAALKCKDTGYGLFLAVRDVETIVSNKKKV